MAISDLIGHADRHLPLKVIVGGILDDVRIEANHGTPIAELENPAYLAADLSDGNGDDYTAEEGYNETVSLARLFAASPDLYSALVVAAEALCSARCPSVKKTGEPWTHCPECQACQDALAKAVDGEGR